MLTDLSDEELLSRLDAIRVEGRALLARLLVYLIEVEDRRLHLEAACSSLFDFCTHRLGMSEGEAFRRINAARLARRFPRLLGHIERGEIYLSTLVLLRDHLTDANVEELVAATSGKSKREVQELLARRTPRPDVPATIRKLPAPRSSLAATGSPNSESAGSPASPRSTESVGSPAPPGSTKSASSPESAGASATAANAMLSAASRGAGEGVIERAVPGSAGRIEPLSEARYRVQLTASVELRDKLERARALMRHRNPSGDHAVVVERALDVLLERLETERLGKKKRSPRDAPDARDTRGARDMSEARDRRPPARPGRVTRQVRRAVFERDGEQCTFVDGEGRRCPASTLLELDHIDSRALGGSEEAANLRVYCRPHNRLHAERVFGKEHVARRIHFRQRKSTRAACPNPPPPRIDVTPRSVRAKVK